MKEQPQFLTTKELGSYLGLSLYCVYKLVRKPGFPAVKIGSRILTDKKRLDCEWLPNNFMGKGEK